MADLKETDVRKLWRAYKKLGSELARHKLIEFYLPLADYIAQRVSARMPPQVTLAEIKSDARLGLMDAVERYDPWDPRQVKFQSYAQRRIAGQIIDEMRTRDWTPRTVLARSKSIRNATEAFAKEHGKAPTIDELRQFMGLDPETFDRVLKDATDIAVVSLSNLIQMKDDESDFQYQWLLEADVSNPGDNVADSDFRDVVCRSLTRTERLLLILYFWENLTMRQAGQAVGLSESRVSQVLSSILSRLRVDMAVAEFE